MVERHGVREGGADILNRDKEKDVNETNFFFGELCDCGYIYR